MIFDHWYPKDMPLETRDRDRRPQTVLWLWQSGSQTNNPRGLRSWWYDEDDCSCVPTDQASCLWDGHFDWDTNENGEMDVGETPNPNGRPDAIDGLISELDRLYEEGWRRIILFQPAGKVVKQDMAGSQWYTMPKWKRDWFENDVSGVKAWMNNHLDVEISVYQKFSVGWYNSICEAENDIEQPTGDPCDPLDPSLLVDGNYVYPCDWLSGKTGQQPHTPRPNLPSDLALVERITKPWQDLGIGVVWDAAGGSARDEACDIIYSPAYYDSVNGDAYVHMAVEGIPKYATTDNPCDSSVTRNEPHPYYLDRMPAMMVLHTAERTDENGGLNPWKQQPGTGAWVKDADPSTVVLEDVTPDLYETAVPAGVTKTAWRWEAEDNWEASMLLINLPTLKNPITDEDEWKEPWSRSSAMELLHRAYVSKGFTLIDGSNMQWDDVPTSGLQSHQWGEIVKRIYGFGMLKDARDFNGDGVVGPEDAQLFVYHWNLSQSVIPAAHEHFTYFHGDINNDGVVDGIDLTMYSSFNYTVMYPPQGPNPICPVNYDMGAMRWDPNAWSAGIAHKPVPRTGGANGDWYRTSVAFPPLGSGPGPMSCTAPRSTPCAP